MLYEILYKNNFPVVSCILKQGEAVKAESDAMIAMSDTMTVKGKMDGGILGGIKRQLSGESIFLQELCAEYGSGSVILGHALPGGIEDVSMDGSYDLIVQKGSFLACTKDVRISTKVQSPWKGIFSKAGFFLLRLKGTGTAFISSYGVIHPLSIPKNREMVIDNGHLVAWPDYMDYSIERASKGILSSITSGEGLVCRFRGPGTILIQTRNPKSYGNYLFDLLGLDNLKK